MKFSTSSRRQRGLQALRATFSSAVLAGAVLGILAGPASATPCTVIDDGSGTVVMPPAGCGYLSPADVHTMIQGLPPGTTIIMTADHSKFGNIIGVPDGSGGLNETFSSFLFLNMQGTGSLSGFTDNAGMPVQCKSHTGPRGSGSTQNFTNEMVRLEGFYSDATFQTLHIFAGSDFGLPCTGRTRLVKQGNQWMVNSCFIMTFKIEFVGKAGGVLGGRSGTTLGQVLMCAGDQPTVSVPGADLPEIPHFSTASPNPFGPSTTISFQVEQEARVILEVADVTGRIVRTTDGGTMSVGAHQLIWDGRDDDGRSLEAGTYYYFLRLNDKVVTADSVVKLK